MKKVVIPFTRRLKHNLKEPRMGDVTIKFSENIKYLGITLLWNSHMKKTKKKAIMALMDCRIAGMVAEIWRSDHCRNAPKNTKASMPIA
jgi:hypothetical protein